MPNALKYSDSGERFQLVLSDVSGGVNSEVNPAFLLDNEWASLTNFLLHLRPPIRKRGSLLRIGSSTYGGVLGYYSGQLVGALTLRPYYMAGATHYAQAGAAAVTLSSGTSFALAAGNYYTPPAQVGDVLVFACATGCAQFSGTAHTVVTGATATFTTGSTDVTGLAGITTSHIGSLLTNTQDSASTVFSYRIVARISATQVTIDRVYAGSRNGVASTWRVSSVEDLRAVSGRFTAAQSSPVLARCALGAFQRMLLLNTTEGGVQYPNRGRWSGLVGVNDGTEGTTPFSGAYGYSATGYQDINTDLGEIVGACNFGDNVVIFHREGITITNGSPTYSGIGSLDFSVKYPGFRLSVKDTKTYAYGPYCVGAEGVFFYDRARGACIWDGSGPPRSLSLDRVMGDLRTIDPDTVGYYRGYALFSNSAIQSSIMAYYAPTDAWTNFGSVVNNANSAVWDTSLWDTGVWGFGSTGSPIGSMVVGRSETGHAEHLVGLSTLGTILVNVSNTIDNPGDAVTDWDSQPIGVQLTSALFGDTTKRLQPDTVRMTYKSVGSDALVTVSTGLPGAASSIVSTTQFGATTTAETQTWDAIACAADDLVQAALTVSGSVTVLEVYQIVIEGAVVGDWDSL